MRYGSGAATRPESARAQGPCGFDSHRIRLYNRKAIRSIRVAVSRTETLNARGGEWQVGAERRGPGEA